MIHFSLSFNNQRQDYLEGKKCPVHKDKEPNYRKQDCIVSWMASKMLHCKEFGRLIHKRILILSDLNPTPYITVTAHGVQPGITHTGIIAPRQPADNISIQDPASSHFQAGRWGFTPAKVWNNGDTWSVNGQLAPEWICSCHSMKNVRTATREKGDYRHRLGWSRSVFPLIWKTSGNLLQLLFCCH